MRSNLLVRLFLSALWLASAVGNIPQAQAQALEPSYQQAQAPSVSVITVSATPSQILADGNATADVLITLMEDGLPGQRKLVNVNTDLGTMNPIVVLTNYYGQAHATLKAGKIPGTATITAWNDDTSGQDTILLLPATPTKLTAEARPPKLDADGASYSYIVTQVLGMFDLPVQGYTLTITTTLGTIPITGVTDAQGIAVVHLTAGTQIGTAVVTIDAPPLQTTVPVEFVTPRLRTYLPVMRK